MQIYRLNATNGADLQSNYSNNNELGTARKLPEWPCTGNMRMLILSISILQTMSLTLRSKNLDLA